MAKPNPERAAMLRYSTGDDAAFAELYSLLAPRLHRYLLQRTRDRALADDLFQQTLLQLHRSRRSYIPGADVASWVLAIARHLVIDHQRRGVTKLALVGDEDADAVADEGSHPDQGLEAAELAARFAAAVEQLSPRMRSAVELKGRGLSLPQAAATLDISVGALKVRLHRAQRTLRMALAGG